MLLLQLFIGFIGIPLFAFGMHRFFMYLTQYVLASSFVGQLRTKASVLPKAFLVVFAITWLLIMLGVPSLLSSISLVVLAAVFCSQTLILIIAMKERTVREQMRVFLLEPWVFKRYGALVSFTVGVAMLPFSLLFRLLSFIVKRTAKGKFYRTFKRFGVFGFVLAFVVSLLYLIVPVIEAIAKIFVNGLASRGGYFENDEPFDAQDYFKSNRAAKGSYKSGPYDY
jgi:hypothetical protein